MPKALCLSSLAVAILILLLFLYDLVMRLLGMVEMTPLRGASMLMDVAFIIFGALLAFLSWSTYREQA